MNRHLRKVPGQFDRTESDQQAGDEADGPHQD